MNLEELTALVPTIDAAAHEAATFIMSGYRKHPSIEFKKNSSDLVTKFDVESEALLRKALAPTGIAVVGEEKGGATAARVFYVDPVDGTTNFAHGHPFFCVSIGLVEDGVSIYGVVVAPALGITYRGGVGIPATRSSVTAVVSEVGALEEALLATGFPYDRRTNPDNNFDAFIAIKQRCQAIRRCGSAALDLCLVADGTYDGYWERKLQAWDIAGGCAIVAAAGGRTSSFDGTPADFSRGHVVATNGKIHDALLEALANVPPSRAL